MKYKIINKAFQPIRLINAVVPSFEQRPDNFIIVDELTPQIKNLEKKGVLIIKKI